ncbi:MAG TPA: alanine--tRNA ligase, partial [Vicinamibacterales bacterium]|nr:alanine--tRNA ligase [Vicinamibacterales bacterium]
TEIRASFLSYFENHGHRTVPSSSLVPHDDPSLLFTNAGMNQFKDVFLGKEQRGYTRAASCQKCMRVSGKHNDLENVGPSPSHHTFFQMLGNFSFGDYFKKDAIGLAWELLTEVWQIPRENLFVTVFKGESGIPRDVDARDYWLQYISADHLSELGSADNFWQMGETGPCGRCSEIYYFRGNHIPCSEPVCRGVECSCSRYIEIWNNVFMEFDRQADGELKPLPAPSIDTGMGLERICAVLQDVESNYDTDLFAPLLDAIGTLAGKKYGRSMGPDDVSMRVVADHVRSMTFLIADGVIPSNEFRGYSLRKIMRRAMRHGMRLGMSEPFLHRLVDVVAREMGDAYPELRSNRNTIVSVIRNEEDRFIAVLAGGLPKLEDAIELAAKASGRQLSGNEAFKLYDTFGMPLDFIEDLAGERQVGVDREAFERAMEGQRQKARAKSAFEGKKGQEFVFASDEAQQGLSSAGDRFEGYTTTTVKGTPVIALFDKERRQVRELPEGSEGYAALGQTPFYVESGGQVSDVGQLRADASGASASVEGLTRIAAGLPRLHHIQLTHGTLKERDLITAEVDEAVRDATRRNHTATHLLHAALRKVLGPHVKQAGSLVAPDRLRFDFVHASAVTRDQTLAIERMVNEQIVRNVPVGTEERSTQEAMASGAMALFGEKYGERVRVVSIPGFSMELCGGTHCRATGEIGFFAITSESGVAAGVRRIEAVTGAAAVQLHQATRTALEEVTSALGTTPDRARTTVEQLQAEAKRLTREVSKLKVEGARSQQGQPSAAVEEAQFAGGKFVAQQAEGLGKDELRQLADAHRDRIKSGVVVIGSKGDGKLSIVVAVTKDLVPRVHAGQIVKQIAPLVGGSGGGRPDFAEAGGKDASRIPEALAEAKRVVEALLKS